MAEVVLAFHEEHLIWPGPKLLLGLVPTEARPDVEAVRDVPDDERAHAEVEGREQLRKKAVSNALIDSVEILEEDPAAWDRMVPTIQKALRTAEPAPEAFEYGQGIIERHQPEKAVAGLWRAPTGIETLDRAMRGGLAPGELGLIMAPTKRGKSHIGVWFGAQTLLLGRPVLHITLELKNKQLACRYDRCLTGMDSYQIEQEPHRMEKLLVKTVPDMGKLQIVAAPRYSLGPADVTDLIDNYLQIWGERCLVIVDYGSILQRDMNLPKFQGVGQIHEQLHSTCQRLTVPMWTPYQTNRGALTNSEDGEIGMEFAGESYESLQHADVILTLGRTRGDVNNKRLRINLEATRDTDEARSIMRYDWARSRLEEME